MWPEPRSTSVPSGVFIHPAVWPQQTWAENWGALPPFFAEGQLGTHVTQSRQHAKFHLDPSNRLATIHQCHRQDRQTGQDRERTFYKRSPKIIEVHRIRSAVRLMLPKHNVTSVLLVCGPITSSLYGMADTQLQRLQSVHNAAVRLVTGTRRSEHITPVLRSLHWLPVRQRITLKVATIVHKCLNGRAPGYLSNDPQNCRYPLWFPLLCRKWVSLS